MARRRKGKWGNYTNAELREAVLYHLNKRADMPSKGPFGNARRARSAFRELERRRKQKVSRKKGYINVMGKWVRVD